MYSLIHRHTLLIYNYIFLKTTKQRKDRCFNYFKTFREALSLFFCAVGGFLYLCTLYIIYNYGFV